MSDLGRLRLLGERPLLIMCDYDGTLAPLVPRPEDAWPQPGTREALGALLDGGRHEVAVVTGREVRVARQFLGLPKLKVVGLHGLEWPDQPPPQVDERGLAALRQQLLGLLPPLPGLRLEDKRFTLAVHYREVPPQQRGWVEEQLGRVSLPPSWERLAGKCVREFRPAGAGKGRAAIQLADASPWHHPVFLGDDLTDEEAFTAVSRLRGVTVKVGAGETVAAYRLRGPEEVVELLRSWAGT